MPRTAFRWVAAASAILAVAAAATRPRYGGTLRIVTRGSVEALDPSDGIANATEEKLAPLVFETLVRIDATGKPQPALAIGWEHDREHRRWQFRLRSGVRLHDGSPLSAAAAAASLSAAGWPASVSAEGVTIQTERPSPELPFALARPRATIFARGVDGSPVGSGPFRLSEFQPGRRAVFTAYEEHWGGRPFLDAVAVEMGAAPRDPALELEAGRAEAVELLPDQARRAVQRGLTLWSSGARLLAAVVFERGRPAAEDARVREAIALTLDRTAILNVLLQRHGTAAASLLPQSLSGYAFLFPASRDPARARQLLPRPPQPLVLSYSGPEPLARLVAERIAVDAREAGITLQVSAQGAADVRLDWVRIGASEPGLALAETVAALRFADALRLPSPAPLEAVYQAERALLAEHRIVPLFHTPELYAVHPRVRTWNSPGLDPAGEWRFEDVWLAGESQ